MKKLVLVVLDGLGDRPIRSLGNKTPLEYADTPHMDSLAREGRCGLMYTVGKGFPPESDAAMYAIAGYDPFKGYTGRAAFEALGLGITLGKGQVAMRGNFATVQDGVLVDARAGRIGGRDAEELVSALREIELSVPVRIRLERQEGYRFLAIFESDKLSPNVSNTHPGYKRTEYSFSTARKFELGKVKVRKCVALDKGSEFTAEVVNEFADRAHEVLEAHPINRKRDIPANYILLRDAADGLPEVEGLDKRYGMRWGAVTERTVEKGMCSHLGMEIVKIAKEKDLVRDCKNKVDATIKNIGNYDCIYVYIKGPDKPSHDGDVLEKVRVIEEIDKHLIAGLVNGLEMDETVICVTSDHCTPCGTRSHSDDPVPLLIHGAGRDSCTSFSEPECARGSIGTVQGRELMELLVKTLNFKRMWD
jgi:2,3-bisphosphoglycerate-independent phosphoglycerate mutase